MKMLRHRWWIGSLALFVLILLGTAPLQAAQPPQGARWVPFGDTAAPAAPALTLLAADAAQIDLAAALPGCTAEDIATDSGIFTRLSGGGYGHPADIGRPDLPVLRRDVEIPWGAEVTVEVVAVEYRDTTLSELGLRTIYPMQPPRPKVEGAENRPLSFDRAFYQTGQPFEAPVRLGEAYVVRGHRVQPVEVWPVAYDARTGAVRLYSQITFRLVLDGSDMTRTAELAARYASPTFEQSLAGRVLNYNQGRPLSLTAAVGYLIITADAYYDEILPLAGLRAGRGFEVTVTKCSEIAGGCLSTAAIKTYIQNAYDNWPIPPSHVLLVGDTDTVAGWSSVSAGEITDLYYATMDGGSDWHPDIGRGRFPVRSAAQTAIMVDKYLAYAYLTGQEPWVKKDAFIATCDLYQVAEGTHNYVINSYTIAAGYTGIFPNNPEPGGDKLYCITHGATKADMTASFNDGRLMIVYSGHGGHTGWEVGNYSSDDVRTLEENVASAFVASHACITGDFALVEVFGETWVLQENKAALVFWGSSDNSYWDEDDVLERVMFDALFTPVDAYLDVTGMTYAGLAAVESAYPGMARYYWETYNILGDPALKVFMEPDLPTFVLNVEPTEHEVCQSGTVTSSVVIGSIMGYSETVDLEVTGAPAGVTATLVPDSAQAPYTATLTIEVSAGAPAGDYTLLVTATDHLSWTHDAAVLLHVRPGAPDAPVLTTPPDGAANQPLAPTMGWAAAPYAGSYNLQVDYTPLFAAPLLDVSGLAALSYTAPAPLEGGRCYWWRAQGENLCGVGDWAEPFHYSTVALASVFYDNIESGGGLWSHQAAQGVDNWQISTQQSHSPTHAWHVPDDSIVTDSRLWNTTAVPVGAGSTLTFWHRYEFEGASYDGAVLEISTNGGSSWGDLGAYITANGYNGTISSCCSNPLGGRQGWTGDLTTWTQVEVDLNAFAGQGVNVRWRIGCDSSYGDTGWYIDDVQITAPMPPNPAPVITSITPAYGTPWTSTPVQIDGSGFVAVPSARLGATWLLSVTLVSSTTLDAVVPAGMEPGTYDLTLYNGDCQEAVLLDAFHIVTTCVTPTVALAAGSPVELGTPMAFTATVDGTPPFTYLWDFGGPGSGTGLDTAAPVFTYTAYGTFTVTVHVSNPCGIAAAGVGVEVLCSAPAAAFDSNSPVELGEPMHFSSTVTGTGPFSYTWDFGDGVGASGAAHPVYTYTAAGDYTVTLTVEGPCGTDAYSDVVRVLAGCAAPTASFTSDSPVELGEPVHFSSTVTGTGPFSYTWDFGDGAGASGAAHPVYTYTAAGDYTVTLTVEGPCGTDAYSDVVRVLAGCTAPTASFTSDSPVELGASMHFASTVTGTGPFSYTWDFGDGVGASGEAHPTYTYTAAGSFTVTLSVQGPCGTDTAGAVVNVLPVLEPYWCYLPIVVVNR